MYIYIYTHICTYSYMYLYVNTYAHVYVCVYVFTGICTCIHMHNKNSSGNPKWLGIPSTTLVMYTLQCVAVCCSVLQCVAVCCSVLQCVAVCCGIRDLVCCSALQCVTVCCRVLQCVAACCRVSQWVESDSRDHTTLQHIATHCNTLQHAAPHCNTPQLDEWSGNHNYWSQNALPHSFRIFNTLPSFLHSYPIYSIHYPMWGSGPHPPYIFNPLFSYVSHTQHILYTTIIFTLIPFNTMFSLVLSYPTF